MRLPLTKRQSLLLQIFLTIVFILALILFLTKEMGTVRAFIISSGWVGLVASLGLYGLLGLSPIPSEPLTLLLGTIYHPLTVTLVAGTGNLLAALIEYVLGERIGSAASFEQRKQALPFGLGKLPVHSVPFLLATRMLPGYGPKFISLISGMYRVPLWRYLWTAAIPTYLGAAIFAYGGFGLLQILPIQ